MFKFLEDSGICLETSYKFSFSLPDIDIEETGGRIAGSIALTIEPVGPGFTITRTASLVIFRDDYDLYCPTIHWTYICEAEGIYELFTDINNYAELPHPFDSSQNGLWELNISKNEEISEFIKEAVVGACENIQQVFRKLDNAATLHLEKVLCEYEPIENF